MPPKNDELRNFAKLSNVAVIDISKSILENSFLSSEIQIDIYNTLCCDPNRQGGGGIVCHVINNLSYGVEFFSAWNWKYFLCPITTRYEANNSRNHLSTI